MNNCFATESPSDDHDGAEIMRIVQSDACLRKSSSATHAGNLDEETRLRPINVVNYSYRHEQSALRVFDAKDDRDVTL